MSCSARVAGSPTTIRDHSSASRSRCKASTVSIARGTKAIALAGFAQGNTVASADLRSVSSAKRFNFSSSWTLPIFYTLIFAFVFHRWYPNQNTITSVCLPYHHGGESKKVIKKAHTNGTCTCSRSFRCNQRPGGGGIQIFNRTHRPVNIRGN